MILHERTPTVLPQHRMETEKDGPARDIAILDVRVFADVCLLPRRRSHQIP